MDDRSVFFQVVESRGFSAVAERLETTTASVSRRVKALAAASREPEGELRVAAPMSLGQRKLSPAVVRFATLHPGCGRH